MARMPRFSFFTKPLCFLRPPSLFLLLFFCNFVTESSERRKSVENQQKRGVTKMVTKRVTLWLQKFSVCNQPLHDGRSYKVLRRLQIAVFRKCNQMPFDNQSLVRKETKVTKLQKFRTKSDIRPWTKKRNCIEKYVKFIKSLSKRHKILIFA